MRIPITPAAMRDAQLTLVPNDTRLGRLIADSTCDEVASTLYAVARMRGLTPDIEDLCDWGGVPA